MTVSLISTLVNRLASLLAPSLLAVAALASACSRGSSTGAGPGGQGGRGGAAPVVVGKAELKVVPLELNTVGTIEPIRTASIRAQVTGVMRKIGFTEGQDVNVGDLLFEIDPSPFQNALAQARANQEKAQVSLRTASSELARYRMLFQSGNLSSEQFQVYQDAESTARASVAAAEAEAATDSFNLANCSVRAPIAGRTGSVGAHEGDLVKSGDAVLVVINQLSPIYATFSVAQQNLALITQYRNGGAIAVSATAADQSDHPEKGSLVFIDNAIDQPTGTLKLKAAFPNEDHLLWPGQFTSIRVTLASPEVLAVPASAVQTGQKGDFVFVVRPDQTAEMRAVTVERKWEGGAVISSGLKEGETVVIDGQLRVVPGKPVSFKGADAPATARGGQPGDRKKTKS